MQNKKGFYINYGVLTTGLDIARCIVLKDNRDSYDIIIDTKQRDVDIYENVVLSGRRLRVKKYHVAFGIKSARKMAERLVKDMYKGLMRDIDLHIKALNE